jgi:prepilin-type N-terminal cleavage/methylation domain-containing protein
MERVLRDNLCLGAAGATPRAASRVRGAAFTLLELLVALAMAGIIAGSMYAALRTGFRARAAAEAAVEPARTAALATALLRADFESARPAAGTLSGPFVGTDTTGDRGLPADAVDFYTLGDPTDPVATAAAAGTAYNSGPAATVGGGGAPSATGEARPVTSGLVSYPGPGGVAEQCLVRRVNTNLLAQVEPEPYEEVLCRNIRSLNVRYFDGLTWQDSWDSTTLDNNLPSAVELTIELERAVGGQPVVMQFPRVFLVSCSTLSPTNNLQNAAQSGTSGGAAGGAP